MDDGIAAVKLTGIAIKVRYRGVGGELADIAVQELVRCSGELAAARGASGVIVVAWVDPPNAPSQRMLDRNGFRWRSRIAEDIEDWILDTVPARDRS